MKVQATREFQHTVYGNVSKGEILEVSEGHGRALIESGMAKEHSGSAPSDQPAKEDPKPTFTQPTKEETPGSQSQADQASLSKTAKKSAGGKKAKKAKSQS